MAVYEIPLDPQPQTFAISLANVVYNLTVKWNDQRGNWFLDIADSSNNPLIGGIPLTTGNDLLAQYAYLGFGGQLQVQTDHNTNQIPTYDNLGISSHLFFIVV